MKLRERQIEDLHQRALYEHRDRLATVRRINRRYQEHVEYLARVIRRAAGRRRLPLPG
jgi:hypothetical protein